MSYNSLIHYVGITASCRNYYAKISFVWVDCGGTNTSIIDYFTLIA